MIEAIVDRDEKWDKSLEGKEQYIDRPIQPPGLLGSGKLTRLPMYFTDTLKYLKLLQRS